MLRILGWLTFAFVGAAVGIGAYPEAAVVAVAAALFVWMGDIDAT